MKSNLSKLTRQTRIFSGGVLFVVLSMHLFAHASGVFGLEAMEQTGELFGAFNHSPWTLWVLPTALAAHFICAFEALLRRYSLRSLTPYQWVQYTSGFLLPILLIVHLATISLSRWLLDIDVDYEVVFIELWGASLNALFMVLLLVLVSVHSGLGIWFFLNSRPWFWRVRQPVLFALFLFPLLATLGVFSGANSAQQRMTFQPEWAAKVRAEKHISPAWEEVRLSGTQKGVAGYLVFFGLFLALQTLLAQRGRKKRVFVTYPDGQKIGVTSGSSLLDASNLARIPHAQLCQGQGRCSTCRVFLAEGANQLDPMGKDEREVLSRFKASDNIRLACQAKLRGDCRVDLLISPEIASVQSLGKRQKFISDEKEVVILFSDIRGFTQFSEHRLPYDVVFILNRYFQDMGRIIEKHGGYLDKFIGDGTMAIFGLSQPPEISTAQSLAASKEMADALAKLNAELTSELSEPLRIGIGLHLGRAIVGEMGYKSALSLTAIGDVVNTSSRLESMTKEARCFLICSDEVAQSSKADLTGLESGEVAIRGKTQPQKVWYFPTSADIPSPE